tara:strand:- start:599 stop:1231 length:633 start_codon:yes stop_codon:yes gene_type:complete
MGCIHSKTHTVLNDLSEDVHLRNTIKKDIKTQILKTGDDSFVFDCPCMKRKQYSSEMIEIIAKYPKKRNDQWQIPGMYIHDHDLHFSPSNPTHDALFGTRFRSASCPSSLIMKSEEKKPKRNIYINTCESPKIRQVTPCHSRTHDSSNRNSWQSNTSSEEWHTPRKHDKEDDICCHVSRDVHDNTFTFSYDPDLIDNIYLNYERIRSHSL